MKKNNRQEYLKAWLTYLKEKNQIDPKALADFLGKTLKGALAPITMKRYTATIIGNLQDNGFLAGKAGKTFTGEPSEIVREITPGVLDKCLTYNYKKGKFTEPDQPVAPLEVLAEAPAVKKPRKADGKKRAEKPEVVARKPAKGQAKKTVKPEPKKPLEAKAEKPKKGEGYSYQSQETSRKKSGRKPR